MNAIAGEFRDTRSMSNATCFHCGEALADSLLEIRVGTSMRPVCCAGCAAAANWINDSGLDDYYRLRSADGNRIDREPMDFGIWDRAEIQREHVLVAATGNEITVVVEGMRCAACAWLIDRALSKQPGVIAASVNAVTGRLRLSWDPTRAQLSQLLSRVAALGYRPHLAGGAALERERRRERNAMLLRLGLALLAATQAMMFSEALYLDSAHQMPLATRDFFRWLTLLVCTPVVFYSGMPFIAGMLREWRQRAIAMDTLAGSSILLAYGASVIETVRGGPHVWFDAAAMFVLFLLAARALERFARLRAQAQLDLLARAQPALAWRVHDGRIEQVALTALALGDIVNVPADSTVPADGVLLDAEAAFDESLLSGESAPRGKKLGDPVYAGSVATRARASIRITGVGAQTRLSQIQRLVMQAQAQRPALALLADRLASRFVLTMLAVAVLATAAWWRHDPGQAFAIGLAVLVAACPCALSLAVPAALSAANDALARGGILILGDNALERLARIDTVLFDKTGTLTEGHPRIQSTQTFAGISPERAHDLAAALELGNKHPLAQAFSIRSERTAVQSVRTEPGLGVEGQIDGLVYRFGRADFAANRADDGGLWLGESGTALARFVVRDCIRNDACSALAQLRDIGMDVQLASGDAETTTSEVAATLGIREFSARQSPEHKLARLRALQANGRCVLMVGDGINDAPVLAGADVSMAMGDGSALAQRAADVLLLGEPLQRVPAAIVLARKTRQVLRQNLVWALAYNVVAVSIAAAGWIHPGFAALGMAGSSLGVTLNSLRLARIRVAS
jgi:Cu2+-exporting ATPase